MYIEKIYFVIRTKFQKTVVNCYNSQRGILMKKIIANILVILTLGLSFIPTTTSNVSADWWDYSLQSKKACTYLMSNLGYTRVAAAGVLGNFRAESGINPYVREWIGNHNTYPLGKAFADQVDPDYNGYGPGWGLAQWGDGSGLNGLGSGRYKNLVSYVNKTFNKNYGTSFNDGYYPGVYNDQASITASIPNLYEQLSFAAYEMRDGSGYVSRNELNRMTSTDATAAAVMNRYEYAATSTLALRQKNAREIYTYDCTGDVKPDTNGMISDLGNDGNIDDFRVDGNNIYIRGWSFNSLIQPASATTNVAGSSVVLLMDVATNKEITRVINKMEYRNDVASSLTKYGYKNGGYGGFNLTIPLTDAIRGKKVYPVVRFASDSAGNKPIVSDNVFKNNISTRLSFITNTGNVSNVDQFANTNNGVVFKGWSFNEYIQPESKILPENILPEIIFLEKGTNKEVYRTSKGFYYHIYADKELAKSNFKNGGYGGIDVTIPKADTLIGKTIFPVIRYTKTLNGVKKEYDNWLTTKTLYVEDVNAAKLNASAHVQTIGWQQDNATLIGTTGKSLRLEAIKLNGANFPADSGITYSTHIQDIGWQQAAKNGEISGTTGKSLRVEAINIKLYGQIANEYDIYYRVHSKDLGWLGWTKNGQNAGTTGKSLRAEAIEIKLIKKTNASKPPLGNSYIT